MVKQIFQTNIEKIVPSNQSTIQKQPSRVVDRKRCSENMQQIYRRTPMPKFNFNEFAKELYWIHIPAWVFPLYLQHIFGTHFPRNTSWWLLLTIPHKNPETNHRPPSFNVVWKYLRQFLGASFGIATLPICWEGARGLMYFCKVNYSRVSISFSRN